ncbi:MAG: hypothetical protein DELT_00984 [Desulfovibrio sp.]
MQQRRAPDIYAESPLGPELLSRLEGVLRKLQEKIAISRSPGQQFALIHLVEDLSIADWQIIAKEMNVHGWFALPLDKEDGVPLLALRATLEELAFQRDHDILTGLANRRLFDRQLHSELERAYRTTMPLSLVMIDIDHFKNVNDTYGHLTGDKVLAALGDLLLGSLRIYDVAARIGGEEFCVMLPGANGRQAVELARRLLEDFSQLVFEGPEGETFSATFSAGVATSIAYPETSASELLAQADEFLYDAKNAGRNRVVSRATKHTISENPALVQAAEKQFLFTGKA